MDQSVDHDDILIDIVCVLYGDARNQVKLEQPLRCWWSVACELQERKRKIIQTVINNMAMTRCNK